jgi:hypothetical protein
MTHQLAYFSDAFGSKPNALQQQHQQLKQSDIAAALVCSGALLCPSFGESAAQRSGERPEHTQLAV